MLCRVAYRIGVPPGRLTRMLVGMLSIDEGGIRIEGPVPYRAGFTEVRALDFTSGRGQFFIAIRFSSSPPVFVTPILATFLGFIRVIHPPLNDSVYAELYRRWGGAGRCAGCGSRPRTSGLGRGAGGETAVDPSPGSGRSRGDGTGRWPGQLLALAAILVLLAAYVSSYYRLSRRGMREAKVYGMTGFLYEPAEKVFATKDLSGHYALARLYAPVNWLDQTLLGGDGPVRGITWGLSKE